MTDLNLDAAVEAAAEAVYALDKCQTPWDSGSGGWGDLYRKEARAALAAALPSLCEAIAQAIEGIEIPAHWTLDGRQGFHEARTHRNCAGSWVGQNQGERMSDPYGGKYDADLTDYRAKVLAECDRENCCNPEAHEAPMNAPDYAFLRQVAEAATDGPWEAKVLGSEGYAVMADNPNGGIRRITIRRLTVASCGHEEWETDKANAEYVAAWVPQTARQVLDERDELLRWKSEAMEVMDGLQELGKALGLSLGDRITGPKAIEAVNELLARLQAVEQERDSAEAAIDRYRLVAIQASDSRDRAFDEGRHESFMIASSGLHRCLKCGFEWVDEAGIPEPCGARVGVAPGFMNDEQYDPIACRCALMRGHDGLHQCRCHDNPDDPLVAPERRDPVDGSGPEAVKE